MKTIKKLIKQNENDKKTPIFFDFLTEIEITEISKSRYFVSKEKNRIITTPFYKSISTL